MGYMRPGFGVWVPLLIVVREGCDFLFYTTKGLDRGSGSAAAGLILSVIISITKSVISMVSLV